MPPETMPENQAEAILKLKILDGENLKDFKTNFVRVKMKSLVLAWIDPRFKQSTKTLTTTSTENPTWNFDLDFPLSLQTLHNLNSCATIQVVSPVSAFRQQRVIGTAVLPISDVRFREELFTLQLWRPSGRARGLLRVMARVEINLGFYRLDESVTLPRTDNVAPSAPVDVEEDRLMELEMSGPVDTDPPAQSNFDYVSSSSLLDQFTTNKVEADFDCASSCNSVNLQSADVDRRKNVESVCNCGSVPLPLCDLHTRNKVVLSEPMDHSPNVLRSLLVGFLGGAVAVATVLIGSAEG